MLVDYSCDALRLLVDVSVKAVLLCGVVGLGVWIFRVRNDNVRHRLWTSALVGMLVLPVLVGATPRVPLPGWLWPGLSPRVAAEGVGGEGPSSRMDISSDGSSAVMPNRDRPGELNPRVAPRSAETRSRSTESDVANNAANSCVPAMAPRTAARPESDGSPTPRWPVAAAMIYAVGLGVFLVRLLLGMGRVGAILRRARPVSLDRDGRSTGARIRETSEVRVPMVAGCFRPCILLPDDWSVWSKPMLTSVLGHEEAHIARRDHWVTLLAEINRCLYWFHPAAWLVRRELMRLAELSCDGAVIESTGDRAEYARHLLTVAGRLADPSGRLATCGISMARRINVETRIDAILDVHRPPAKRLGVVGTGLLLVVMIPAVCVFAGLGPAEGKGEASRGTQRPVGRVEAETAGFRGCRVVGSFQIVQEGHDHLGPRAGRTRQTCLRRARGGGGRKKTADTRRGDGERPRRSIGRGDDGYQGTLSHDVRKPFLRIPPPSRRDRAGGRPRPGVAPAESESRRRRSRPRASGRTNYPRPVDGPPRSTRRRGQSATPRG